MTVIQEDALYEFLESATDAFSLDEIVSFIRLVDPIGGMKRLAEEVKSFMSSRNLAFHLEKKTYISRRGCFEPVSFVINPSRLEIMNGILIPGHRCIPFANPAILPHEYSFFWRGEPIPVTTTEGAPEEFYPYYTLFGEEYAPQYVARDNPENEVAFNNNPYDDPPEVSIRTLDMSAIFRESGFVPGDIFVVKSLDWRNAVFELERVPAGSWSKKELYSWVEEAEAAFQDVFSINGPCNSIEEQISYAYWYGGKRIRDIPAYALDDFLYNQTEQIEIVSYGIETRFWYVGKEIPDLEDLRANQGPPDRTLIEEILYEQGIPISEYVIQSYVRDALYRNEQDIEKIVDRVVPPVSGFCPNQRKFIVGYVEEVYEDFSKQYSLFADKTMGPIRQRVCELHTAVIDQVARIKKADIDKSWFPRHTFVIFSQIQGHAASVLEDLDTDEPPEPVELEAMDGSSDSMLETYEEMKNLIEQSIESFRRYKLSVVRDPGKSALSGEWLTFQASLGGTDIWRRFVVPAAANLHDLHRIIQILFGWKEEYLYQFVLEEMRLDEKSNEDSFYQTVKLEKLNSKGKMEFVYEYGTHWTVKLMFLLNDMDTPNSGNYCIAGAGTAPPETIEGPLQFRRYASALKKGLGHDKKFAFQVLGQEFDLYRFNVDDVNRKLSDFYAKII